MGLVFSISNFFINKISHANKWMRKKIPTCSNLALASYWGVIQSIQFEVSLIEFMLTNFFYPKEGSLWNMVQRSKNYNVLKKKLKKNSSWVELLDHFWLHFGLMFGLNHRPHSQNWYYIAKKIFFEHIWTRWLGDCEKIIGWIFLLVTNKGAARETKGTRY